MGRDARPHSPLQGDAYLPWKHRAPVPGPLMLQAPEGTPDCTQAPFIVTSRTLRDHVSLCKPLETLQLWGRLGGGSPSTRTISITHTEHSEPQSRLWGSTQEHGPAVPDCRSH